MKSMIRSYLPRSKWLGVLMLWGGVLSGQSSHFVKITPEKVTLLVGESKTFRMIDQNGQMQRDVSWTISDPDAFQLGEADELVITAKRPGDFNLNARNAEGSAAATVKVMEGTALPQGTVKWSGASVEGCKTIKATPAVPSANGPDVFEQSQCGDGEYLAAYTSDGIQLWRRKIGGAGAPPVAKMGNNGVDAGRPSPGRINLRSTSICDLVEVGNDQQKIRDLLNQRDLPFSSFSEGDSGGRLWTVDESSTECKLWFDGKSVLTKKRKTFVSE